MAAYGIGQEEFDAQFSGNVILSGVKSDRHTVAPIPH
jgi:hypothetical protein